MSLRDNGRCTDKTYLISHATPLTNNRKPLVVMYIVIAMI